MEPVYIKPGLHTALAGIFSNNINKNKNRERNYVNEIKNFKTIMSISWSVYLDTEEWQHVDAMDDFGWILYWNFFILCLKFCDYFFEMERVREKGQEQRWKKEFSGCC